MAAPVLFIRNNLVGFLALFVALSAGAYAVTVAPKNSVVSKSIKNGQVKKADLKANSVTPDKVPDNSMTGADINESTLDANLLQRRVSATCAPGNAVRAVRMDGTVDCAAAGGAGGGGTVTSVDTGFGLTGGPITSNGTIAVDGATVQRRVTGTCTGTRGIQSIDAAGAVVCAGSETGRIHVLVASSNESFGGAVNLLSVGHTSIYGLCHSQFLSGTTVVTGTKVIISNHQTGTVDTLNWFYSDGTTVSSAGQPLSSDADAAFSFVGKRIEGQFIYSEQTSDMTISLHAYDGGSFCEFAGTSLRTTGPVGSRPGARTYRSPADR